MFYAFISLFFIIGESLISINARIIITNQGHIEGIELTARNGRPYTTFFGIPYAKPPIHRLRFLPPVPAGRWNGVLNATKPTPMCPQVNRAIATLFGDENCLYVDVHTPANSRPGDNIPVFVYFFGGGFTAGNTRREGPQYMLERDIIIVMVSSRLSLFGYLSTGDHVIPGNMGLKDQTEALRWTRRYIYDYGGDPNRVLIGGHSSGSACVHLHTMSPLSRGLFHRAMMLSGLGTGPHLFMDPDVAKGITLHLAEKLNCPKDSWRLLECMQDKTAEELVEVSERMLRVWHQVPTAIFRPTVENASWPGAFLVDFPHHGRYRSNVPWIIGMTSGEGALYVNEYFGRTDDLDLYHNMMIPLYGMHLWTARPSHLNYISQLLQSHFFGEEKLGPDTDVAFSDMLTGIMHGQGVLDAVTSYEGPKYIYLWNYRPKFAYQETVSPYKKYLGVGHADELGLMFKEEEADPFFSRSDFDFGNEIITKWLNFAYSGNPNYPFPLRTNVLSEWEPMTTNRVEFLHIRVNGSMEKDYYKEKFQFFRKLPIHSKYGLE